MVGKYFLLSLRPTGMPTMVVALKVAAGPRGIAVSKITALFTPLDPTEAITIQDVTTIPCMETSVNLRSMGTITKPVALPIEASTMAGWYCSYKFCEVGVYTSWGKYERGLAGTLRANLPVKPLTAISEAAVYRTKPLRNSSNAQVHRAAELSGQLLDL
jgi:hypothetical protein